MKDLIKKHEKEIKGALIIVVLVLILSFFLRRDYDAKASDIEAEKNENISEQFLDIDVDIERQEEEEGYVLFFSNPTLFEILEIEFDMYYKGDFFREIQFTDSVAPNSYSNYYYLDDENLDIGSCEFVFKQAFYLNNDRIFKLEIGEYTTKTLLGKMPYSEEKRARYIIPKINVVNNEKESYINAYIQNLTDYEIISYRFNYEDAEDGSKFSITFSDVDPGEKSENQRGNAPSSGLIKDIVPINANIELYDQDGEKRNLLYQFSSGIILDIEKYEEILSEE